MKRSLGELGFDLGVGALEILASAYLFLNTTPHVYERVFNVHKYVDSTNIPYYLISYTSVAVPILAGLALTCDSVRRFAGRNLDFSSRFPREPSKTHQDLPPLQ